MTDALATILSDLTDAAVEAAGGRDAAAELLRDAADALSSHADQPIDRVRWIPINQVQANDYNPNSVAVNEMRLLYTSIHHDGFTQPVVTIYDDTLKKYIIVDGFHRYTVMRSNPDILERTGGCLPCVVLKKDINDRMASTVRHNRARGKHSVSGMANMVFKMLDNGWDDPDICAEVGLTIDELVRLKHVTGFSKLFENVEYSRAWKTRRQIEIAQKYAKEHPDGN